MSNKPKQKLESIPAEEFGKGCKVDFFNNRVIGMSGAVYEDVQVSVADLLRAFPDLIIGKSGAVYDTPPRKH